MNYGLKDRILKSPERYLFLLYAVGVLIMHIYINTDLDDDVVTREITGGYSLFSWIAFRYNNWSARFVHEGIAYFLVWHPVIWKLINAAIMIAIPQLIKYLAGIKGLTGSMCYLLFMWIPVGCLMNTGWICTTITYLWTAFWGLCVFALAKYYIDNSGKCFKMFPCAFIISVIFACNHELMAALIFTVLCYCIIRYRIDSGRISPVLITGLLLDIAQIIFILTAPGNANRVIFETRNQFPEFADLSVFKKTGLGIMRVFENNIVDRSFLFFMLTAVLAAGALMYGRSLAGKFISLIPLFAELALLFMSNLKKYKHPDTNIFSPGYVKYIIIGIICLSAMCVAIFEIFYADGTTGKKDIIRPVFLCVLLITGAGTVAVMGFSPTIYASGTRTATFMYFTWIYLILIVAKKILSHKRFPRADRTFTLLVILLIWGITYAENLITVLGGR